MGKVDGGVDEVRLAPSDPTGHPDDPGHPLSILGQMISTEIPSAP